MKANPKPAVPMPSVPSLQACVGPVGSGKTSWLQARVEELLRRGTDPADVLVVCVTDGASEDLSRHLGRSCVAGAGEVEVTTPLNVALRVLADGAAGGRPPLLLDEGGRLAVMESLRPLGIRQHRLAEMLRFFERSWSDLAHRDHSWLVTHEERDVVEALTKKLDDEGTLLPTQIPAFAVDRLCDDSGLRNRFSRRHVVVDDMDLLGRASQTLLALLAHESMTVAYDPVGGVDLVEPFPCVAGVDELLVASPHVESIALPSREAPFEEQSFSSASDEFMAAARAVRERLDVGVDPREVLVVAEHPTWRANMAIALRSVGVSTDVGQGGVAIVNLRGAWGVRPEFVVVAGCMDGFVPHGDVFREVTVDPRVRNRMERTETHALKSALSSGSHGPALATWTESMSVYDADRLGLEIERISLRDGTRVARLRRSGCLR